MAAARALIDVDGIDALTIGTLLSANTGTTCYMLFWLTDSSFCTVNLQCHLSCAAAKKAMKIAGDACIYTNHNQTGYHITKDGEIKEAAGLSTGDS